MLTNTHVSWRRSSAQRPTLSIIPTLWQIIWSVTPAPPKWEVEECGTRRSKSSSSPSSVDGMTWCLLHISPSMPVASGNGTETWVEWTSTIDLLFGEVIYWSPTTTPPGCIKSTTDSPKHVPTSWGNVCTKKFNYINLHLYYSVDACASYGQQRPIQMQVRHLDKRGYQRWKGIARMTARPLNAYIVVQTKNLQKCIEWQINGCFEPYLVGLIALLDRGLQLLDPASSMLSSTWHFCLDSIQIFTQMPIVNS